MPSNRAALCWTIVGLLLAAFLGWALALSVVFSDGRPSSVYRANSIFGYALVVECIVVISIVIAVCCRPYNHLKPIALCLVAVAATNLATALYLLVALAQSLSQRVPIRGTVISSIPFVCWIIAAWLFWKNGSLVAEQERNGNVEEEGPPYTAVTDDVEAPPAAVDLS